MFCPISVKTTMTEPSASSDQVSALVLFASHFSPVGIHFFSVIQGASDMGKRLSETELQKSLDFCVNLFSPTCPEQHERVANSGISTTLLDVNSPVINPVVLEETLMVELRTEEAKKVGINRLRCKAGGDVNQRGGSTVGLETIVDGVEGDIRAEGKLAKLPPAVQRCDRRMKRSDSDAQKLAETKMVVNKINARRVVHSEYAINNLESEGLNGFVVRLETGKLGLTKVHGANPEVG
jgi:hypothetical protein